MQPLKDRCIVVGVCGGIAAYKAASVISLLTKAGAKVNVIMTKVATEFVGALTFQTLSGGPVYSDMFEPPKEWDVRHISLAKRADAFLIVPATANVIGKITSGIADDMLTTTVMATKAPVIIAPSMNTNMYQNPIVCENINKLKGLGYIFIEPGEGVLACGDTGTGRLPEPDEIVDFVIKNIAYEKDLQGLRVLVTAGATKEAIDPVRYITNHSTGKMGIAVAEAARNRGAKVTLVMGAVSVNAPQGVEVIKAPSAKDMYNAVTAKSPECDIIVKAAAVADFTPAAAKDQKIKKQNQLTLELTKTKDILMQLGEDKPKGQVLVGFCMETQNLIENAQKKLLDKNCDLLVANSLLEQGAGFGSDTNTVTILHEDQKLPIPNMTKKELAHIILDMAKKVYDVKKARTP